jgi:competence protein ComGC
MKSLSRQRQLAGFTLVELLVVMGILFSLAALLLPALAAGKASAKGAHCKSNLRQVGCGLALYCSDAQQFPPDFVRLRAALFRTITERQIFWCPSLDRSRQELNRDFISYDAPTGGQLPGQGPPPPGQVLMEDYGYNQYGSGAPHLLLGLTCDSDNGLAERNVKVPAGMIAAADV